jgi:hypothetical protein
MLLRHRLAIAASLVASSVAAAVASGRIPLLALIFGPKW